MPLFSKTIFEKLVFAFSYQKYLFIFLIFMKTETVVCSAKKENGTDFPISIPSHHYLINKQEKC